MKGSEPESGDCSPATETSPFQPHPGEAEVRGAGKAESRKSGGGLCCFPPRATMDLPVLAQPGLGTTTTTVTTITQTGGAWSTGLFNVCTTTTTVTTITQTGGAWSTGLFNVCADIPTCVVGGLVPCCLDLSLAHHYGECLCLPLLPGSTFAMRVGIRERFKIQGSACEDWTTVYCCYPLAVCQMIREVKTRMKSQIYQVSTTLESS